MLQKVDNDLSYSVQVNWEEYGSDFTGPVSLDDDLDRVVVEQVPRVLSEEERDLLLQQLEPPHSVGLCQDVLLHNYALAKSFVLEACNSH